MSGRFFRQTDIGKRMQAGEVIPAWRPPEAKQPPAPKPEPLPLDVRPISALEAREAAQRLNNWVKRDKGEPMDNDTIRLVCQWVLRVTRGAGE